jgi:hypothetical protein
VSLSATPGAVREALKKAGAPEMAFNLIWRAVYQMAKTS